MNILMGIILIISGFVILACLACLALYIAMRAKEKESKRRVYRKEIIFKGKHSDKTDV
tara:strand:- start:1113 stop:1286 length:174 start_codon:yes stop_codon:yes gene_type:complete